MVPAFDLTSLCYESILHAMAAHTDDLPIEDAEPEAALSSDAQASDGARKDGAPRDSAGKETAHVLHAELQNWQVLEIEGEATVVPPAARETVAAPDGFDEDADLVDSILIAGLPQREITVQAGSSGTLVVSLLNNGSQPAIFDVHVEGWVHDGWLPEGKRHIPMQSGERNALTIQLAPPRDASAPAGEFPLVIVVRSPQHFRRVTKLHATLHIPPFTDFALGAIEVHQADARSRRGRTFYSLPVTNLGNHAISVQLQAQTIGLESDFAFLDLRSETWLANPAVVPIATGETREIALRAQVSKAPLFGARTLTTPLHVVASVLGEVRMPRSATSEINYTPPVKPWHVAAAAIASLLLLLGTAVIALGARFLLDSQLFSNQSAPPPIVIVLNQDAPVGTQVVVPGNLAPADLVVAPVEDVGAQQNGEPVVRMVTADQVTRPGEVQAQPQAQTQPQAQLQTDDARVVSASDISAPDQTARAQAAAVQAAPVQVEPVRAASTGQEALTYGQMFQEIALQYDLDWRLLAAQAYVETGLDALALGNDGDMGLMQVLPSTWREWAPAVGAKDPFDAYSNTLVASAYLDYVRAELGKKGYPQAQWMLVAYNWGPDRLKNFLDEGGTWEQLPAVRARYATDILNIARTIP